MEFRNLGNSGLRVSVVGLGCNNFGARIGADAAREVIHGALDAGISFFDTADTYGDKGGSETILGETLGSRRHDIVLATKFGSTMDAAHDLRGASRRYVMAEIEASLCRLKTDWIDLYYLHFPDPQTPIEETLRALDDLVRQGKVRYIGCSNFAAWQVVEAWWIAQKSNLHHFVCAQNEYSLLVRDPERELLPALETCRLGFVPYFPLASGLLTGKYEYGKPPPEDSRLAAWKRLVDSYLTEANWQRIEALREFARERGHGLLDLAFAWLLARPQVASVIAGATRPEQVKQNAAAAASWRLSGQDLAEIDRIAGD